MKYFTKEWYRLTQGQSYTVGMKKIPDKEYTDGEIEAFYGKALKDMIKREKRDYDTPPDFSLYDVLLEGDFDPNEWLSVNEETGEAKRPKDKEEILASVEKEREEAETAFKARPPFDEEEAKKTFCSAYRNKLKYASDNFPLWVTEEADRRLLALDLLPESVYQKLREEEKANKRRTDAVVHAAKRKLSKQDIPQDIMGDFNFHDGEIRRFYKRGKNRILEIIPDGVFVEEEAPAFVRITFFNAEVLENEAGRLASSAWLYDEIYRLEDGYEVHVLLVKSDLQYLTLRCKDIAVERVFD